MSKGFDFKICIKINVQRRSIKVLKALVMDTVQRNVPATWLLTYKKTHWEVCLYKAVMKPKWSDAIELWGCASKSNIVIMHRSQSKILRAIANAPWYIRNHTLHTDVNISYVSDVIHERINKHHNKLESHPSPLLEPRLQHVNTRRRKRCWPLDLHGTWGDIAGRIPYHVIVIHSVVTYLRKHHTNL